MKALKMMLVGFVTLTALILTGCVEMVPKTEVTVHKQYPAREKGCDLEFLGNWDEKAFSEKNLKHVAGFLTTNPSPEKNIEIVNEKGCELGADGYFLLSKKIKGPQEWLDVHFIKK